MGVRERGIGSSAAHRPFCRPQRCSSRSARAFGRFCFLRTSRTQIVRTRLAASPPHSPAATAVIEAIANETHRALGALAGTWLVHLAGWLAAEAHTIRPRARWPDADKDAREKQTLRGGDAQYRMQVDQDGLWITMDRYY